MLCITKRVFLALALVFLSMQAKSQVPSVKFYPGTYEEALKKAETENQLILLYFTASWCGPCNYMKRYIFTDYRIYEKCNRSYIVLEMDVDVERNREIYFKYVEKDKGVGVPLFLFINYREEVVKRYHSAMKLNQFEKFIDVPGWNKPLSEAAADSMVQARKQKKAIKPPLFTKFMYDQDLSRWKLGVRVGANFHSLETSPSSIDYNENRPGFNFGLFMDCASRHFLVQPGIAYYSKGAKSSHSSEEVRLNYLEVQAKVGVNVVRVPIGGWQPIRVTAAPYAAYALNGKRKTSAGLDNISFGNTDGELDRLDYGIKIGGGLRLGTFEFSGGYDFGLNNLSNQANTKTYNRGFYFNIAVIFGN